MDEHAVTVISNLPGVKMSLNGGGGPVPLVSKAITNSLNRIIAPPTFNGASFVHWSDGDTNPTKTFTMPANDVTFTAIDAGSVVGAPVSSFTAITPYRLFDTRDAAQRPSDAGGLASGGEMQFDMSSQPTAPPDATGVLLNVTATNSAAAGYARAYPCGTAPSISTVNFGEGQTAANLAMVKLPADKRVCFQSLVPTDLVVDVAGWFSPQGD